MSLIRVGRWAVVLSLLLLGPLGHASALAADDGSWVPLAKISASAAPSLVQHGDHAVLAYVDYTSPESPRVISVARWGVSGAWSNRIDHGVGARLRLDSGTNGDTAMTWVRQSANGQQTLHLRRLLRGSSTWSPEALVASLPPGGRTNDFRVAVSDTGATTVAWVPTTEDYNSAPLNVRTMTAEGQWTPTSQLELVGGILIRLAAGRGEAITLSWLAACDPVTQIRSAASGPWTRTHHSSPAAVGTTWCSGSYDTPVITNAAGSTMLVWSKYEGNDNEPEASGTRIYVAVRPADGAWQSPQTLAHTPDPNFNHDQVLTLAAEDRFLLVAGNQVDEASRTVVAYELDSSASIVSSTVLRDRSPSTDAFHAVGNSAGASTVVFEQADSTYGSPVRLLARHRAAGSASWAPAVSVTTSAEQLEGGPGASWGSGGRERPAIALDEEGGSILAWRESQGIGGAATSNWGEIDPILRLAGPDRFSTAVAISKGTWAGGQAQSVVLARSDAFPDALAGTPLAVSKNGPLLLTPPTTLNSSIASEIKRVLPAGRTVYLLGGTAALSQDVADAVARLGYKVTRLSGPDRYSTAVTISKQLGTPSRIFEATGLSFQNALISGVAAASSGGVVVLTADGKMPTATKAYLDSHPGVERVAVGPQAGTADPSAAKVAGSSVYDTARLVADRFFPTPRAAAVASGTVFADALAGGAHIGRLGGPLLLSEPTRLPAPIAGYLSANKGSIDTATLYGGPAALSAGVLDGVRASLRQ